MSYSAGHSTGAPGGFTQSANPFAGLTNTDLRPGRRKGDVRRRRRKRRLRLLLDTLRTRGKEHVMRKDVGMLVDTLRDSVSGIVSSGQPDLDELLTKSFGEFGVSLEEMLTAEYGEEPEPLEKGLNHVQLFARAVERASEAADMVKAEAGYDKPLDRWVDHGVLVLRQMANETAALPESEEDAEAAQEAGALVKVEGNWGEILVKSALPDELNQFLVEPLDLLTDLAGIGSEMVEEARDLAEAMIEQDPEAVPMELVKALPLVFEVDEEPLHKAPPPFARGRSSSSDDDDEEEDAPDTGDDEDDPDDQGAPLSDDNPQNPIETITRLASIIVVISGSLQQAMGATDGMNMPSPGVAPGAADARNVGLQRAEPLLDQPLAKILDGEAEINVPGLSQMTLATAIEQFGELSKKLPALQKRLGDRDEELKLLKQRYEQLAAQPVAARGAAKPVPVSKSADSTPGAAEQEGDQAKLEQLVKNDESGGAAAKFMISRVHQGGGVPLMPPA